MKILRLPQSDPQNFGPKRVRSKKYRVLEEHGQLNLFTSGKIIPMHSRSTFEEALLMDERGDTESAEQLYHQAIKEGDAVADAYCNLGILASEKEEYAQGVNYFTRSLEQDPRHYLAHFNLANIFAEVGDIRLAIVHYQIVIEMRPEFANSYFNLGLMFIKTREYAEAIEMLHKFLRLAPAEDSAPARKAISTLRMIIDARP